MFTLRLKSMINKIYKHYYNKIYFFYNKKNMLLIKKDVKKKSFDVSVSVIIPTYNADVYLSDLIESIYEQKGIKSIEIIVIDSESEDNTIGICKTYDINLIEIKNIDFTHSFARNLGAEFAQGDYLLFMTQDAKPSNQYWLYNMLTPLINYGVVAASCAELPRSNCELAYRINSRLHEEYLGILKTDKIGKLPKIENYDTLRRNGQLNDISCIVSRQVFSKFKYRDDYAEDLDLGIRLIKSGYKIALLSSEKVIHSHNRSVLYYFKRSLVDSRNLLNILPDYPINNQKTIDLIDAILFGYYKITTLIDSLEIYRNNVIHVNELHDELVNFINQSSKSTSISKNEIVFGKEFSNVEIDVFLNYLRSVLIKKELKNDYISNHVYYFVLEIVIPFLIENKNSYSYYDFVDTIYKRFLTVAGNDLSLHLFKNGDDYDLLENLKPFLKGI